VANDPWSFPPNKNFVREFYAKVSQWLSATENKTHKWVLPSWRLQPRGPPARLHWQPACRDAAEGHDRGLQEPRLRAGRHAAAIALRALRQARGLMCS
jgi:hypothetical protein